MIDNTDSKIPLYRVCLDADMVGISLVAAPAVESDFQCFSREPLRFSVIDEDRRLVLGCVIRVDYPILRQASDGSFYNLVFTKEVAEVMLERWLSGEKPSMNIEHGDYRPSGIEPRGIFVKDTERGVNPLGFESVADGSVFALYHISNDGIWGACKSGEFKGFSLEMYADIEPMESMSVLDINDVLVDVLCSQ